MKKDKILACFPFESEPDLASALTRACEKSQAYQLKLSKQRYADDTSGIAVRLHVLSVCPITFQQTLPELQQTLKEVVSLIIHQQEGREVNNLNLPDSFHTQLRVL